MGWSGVERGMSRSWGEGAVTRESVDHRREGQGIGEEEWSLF